MKMRTLGTNLQVFAVGLGCMGMNHAYGEQSTKAEAQKLIETAIENGCTFFDTAEVYGEPDNPHHNEEMLGKILKPYRNQITIATKFGVKFDLFAPTVNKPVIPDSCPEQIRKSVEGSLKHLQTDHIDLYYQHRQDPEIPVEEVAGMMAEVIQEGKITHWGLSEVNEETIRKAYLVPILGTRKLNRLTENLGSADVELTAEENSAIDKAFETMEMSEVFGGAKIIRK